MAPRSRTRRKPIDRHGHIMAQEIPSAEEKFLRLHNKALDTLSKPCSGLHKHYLSSKEGRKCLELILHEMAETFEAAVRCDMEKRKCSPNKEKGRSSLPVRRKDIFMAVKVALKEASSRFVDGLSFSEWEHPKPVFNRAAISPGKLRLCFPHHHDRDAYVHVIDEGAKKYFPKLPMTMAAANGHLPIIEWLHSNGLHACTKEAMDQAASRGALSVVQWLHANRSQGCSTKAMDGAAGGGHLAVVEWLHSNRTEGCSKSAMNEAAMNGYLFVVEWLHKNRTEGCTPAAMDLAAGGGHMNVVKWLHENRSEGCTPVAMDLAAGGGHIYVVEWLQSNRSEGYTIGAMNCAAEGGHLSVVEWLHTNCEFTSDALTLAARGGQFTSDALTLAARGGHLAVMKWLHANYNCFNECTAFAMNSAAAGGYLSVVEWLYANRSVNRRTSSITRAALDYAAGAGHVTVMKWLHANTRCSNEDRDSEGVEVETKSVDAMVLAAANGHLAAVEWLHLNRLEGSYVAERAMDLAALGGHLSVLEWLHAYRGGEGSGRATAFAVHRGHLSVVEWLHKTHHNHELEYSCWSLHEAATNGHLSMLEWLAANDSAHFGTKIRSHEHHGALFSIASILTGAEEEYYQLPVIEWIFTHTLSGILSKYY